MSVRDGVVGVLGVVGLGLHLVTAQADREVAGSRSAGEYLRSLFEEVGVE